MAAPSSVFTIALVAQMLGEDEALLDEIATNMEPEDGCLWVHDVDEREVIAFTSFGIECLKELIQVHKENQSRRSAT